VTPQEYKEKADVVRETAADAGREIDEEHFGALVVYVPDGALERARPTMEAFSARRPEVSVEEIIVTEGHAALRDRLEGFVEQAASKFVVLPVVAPMDWRAELEALREEVAIPLEEGST
jgi:hypothetical protein